MHHDAYVRVVLIRFCMFECPAVSTPADHHVRLCKTFAKRVGKGAPLQGGGILRMEGLMILMSIPCLFVRIYLIVK